MAAGNDANSATQVEETSSNNVHRCQTCRRTFTQRRNLLRHELSHDIAREYRCSHCNRRYARADNLHFHARNCDQNPANRERRHHGGGALHGQENQGGGEENATTSGAPLVSTPYYRIHNHRSAFGNSIKTYRLHYNNISEERGMSTAEQDRLLTDSATAMTPFIENFMRQNRACKFCFSLYAILEKASDDSVRTDPPVVFVSEAISIYASTDVRQSIDDAIEQLTDRMIAYSHTGSGWVLSSFQSLDTSLWKLTPLRGGVAGKGTPSNGTYMQLPYFVRRTHRVVNIQNHRDTHCFKYSVLASLYKDTPPLKRKKAYRVSSYDNYLKWKDVPDFTGLNYPVSFRDIARFEKMNSDISVNVYGVDYVITPPPPSLTSQSCQ